MNYLKLPKESLKVNFAQIKSTRDLKAINTIINTSKLRMILENQKGNGEIRQSKDIIKIVKILNQIFSNKKN